jgi:undecaprenyl-diphosphatase
MPAAGVRPYAARAAILLLAWAGLLALLIAAGNLVVHSSAIVAFDRHVTETVVAHRTPALDAVMKAVTWLGSWVALVVGGGLLAVLTLLRRVPVLGLVVAVVAWAGESSGISLAKRAVQRERPPERIRLITAHGWSWPSGHAGIATVVFLVLAITATYLTANRLLRVGAWVAAAAAIVSVGFSRIELGVHWTTDVIAGTVFVCIWLSVLAIVFAPFLRADPSGAGTPREDGESPGQPRALEAERPTPAGLSVVSPPREHTGSH